VPVRLVAGDFDVVDTGDPIPGRRDAVIPVERVAFADDGTGPIAGRSCPTTQIVSPRRSAPPPPGRTWSRPRSPRRGTAAGSTQPAPRSERRGRRFVVRPDR
jgi:hypothetical protein